MTRRSILMLALLVSAGAVAAAPVRAQTGPAEVRRDIEYAAPGGTSLLLDAYLPAGPGPHPAVLVIPGGKWVEGSRLDTGNVIAANYLAGRGIAAFPLDYRLVPQFSFPVQLEDVQAAVRFLREHAAEFAIDPAQIGAMGPSAGGHLAALLATVGEGPLDTGTRIRVAVSWSGPMDLDLIQEEVEGEVLDVMRAFLGCPGTGDCSERGRQASPIAHLDPTDAPIYLANGTEEVIPVGQAQAMAAAMEASGVPFVLDEVQGPHHGYGYALSEKVMEPSVDFLGAWITGTGGPALVSPGPSTPGSSTPASPQPGKSPAATPAGSGVGAPSPGAKPSSSEPSRANLLLVFVTGVSLVLAAAAFAIVLSMRRRLRAAVGDEPPEVAGGEGAAPERSEERVGDRT